MTDQQIAASIADLHATNKSRDVLIACICGAIERARHGGEREALNELADDLDEAVVDLLTGGPGEDSATYRRLAEKVRARATGKSYDDPIGLGSR